jgi:flagellar FliJ protein
MPRRFNFRLQTVLRVREIRQRETQRAYAAKRAELARLDRLDAETRAQIAAQQADLTRRQQDPNLDPLELARGRAWIAALRKTLFDRQLVRQSLLLELARLRESLRQARIAVRSLETLRNRRLAEYLAARRRTEQADADELARTLPLHYQDLADAVADGRRITLAADNAVSRETELT